MTLKLFVVWEKDEDGGVCGACVVAAQSAEHACTMVNESLDRSLPWAEHVREVAVPDHAPSAILWVMEKKNA